MRLIAHKGYYELVIIVNNEQCFFSIHSKDQCVKLHHRQFRLWGYNTRRYSCYLCS